MSECIFCKIVNGDIKADIVYEDDDIIAFRDINPQAPFHVLVIPREHISGIMGANADIGASLIKAIQKIAEENSLEDGFRVVINNGKDAGQEVEHLHAHILAKRKLAWPPG